MFCGDLGEDLAIERNVLLLEIVDELGVGSSDFANGGIQPDVHERAIAALLLFATNPGICPRFDRGGSRQLDLGLAAPHHPLGLLEDVLSVFDVADSAFDSWHRCFVAWLRRCVAVSVRPDSSDATTFDATNFSLKVGDKHLNTLLKRVRHGFITALVAGDFSGFATVEVVLATFPSEEFS